MQTPWADLKKKKKRPTFVRRVSPPCEKNVQWLKKEKASGACMCLGQITISKGGCESAGLVRQKAKSARGSEREGERETK